MIKKILNKIIHTHQANKLKETYSQYTLGSSVGTKTAWILSYTKATKQRRVLNQAETLRQLGWRVVVICFAHENQKKPEFWHFLKLPEEDTLYYKRWFSIFLKKIRALILTVLQIPLPLKIKEYVAVLYHKTFYQFNWRRHTVKKYYEKYHKTLAPDIILPHDYYTIDIGLWLAKKAGVKLLLDVHEHAASEFVKHKKWVAQTQPYIFYFQNHYFHKCDGISVFSKSICEILQKEHQLKTKNIDFINSAPFYQKVLFNPIKKPIKVLYHGGMAEERDLEILVGSVQFWDEHFTLTLRGGGHPEYIEKLKKIIESTGQEKRIFFEDYVDSKDILNVTRNYDIGCILFKYFGLAIKYCLPQKIFEYTMAGTAVLCSDLYEISNLIQIHNNGIVVKDMSEKNIADALNQLTPEKIMQLKKNSLEAAKTLNAETEQKKFIKMLNTCINL